VALRDQGITILLAEQNAKAALSIADRGYVFENGRITLSGAANDLLNSPEIAERYLGMSGTAETSGAVATSLAEKLRGVLFAGDLEARP
jgi:branched-chain amino acid transport system ATP-binding protein